MGAGRWALGAGRTGVSHLPMEKTDVYRGFCEISDEVWSRAVKFDQFSKDVLGQQLCRAIDSVAANLIEGDARYSDSDAIRFFIIARASVQEAAHHIRVGRRRGLIDVEFAQSSSGQIDELCKRPNRLIDYRRRTNNRGIVREDLAPYDPDDSSESKACSASGPSARRQAPSATFRQAPNGVDSSL